VAVTTFSDCTVSDNLQRLYCDSNNLQRLYCIPNDNRTEGAVRKFVLLVSLMLVFLPFAMHSQAIYLQHLVIISAVTNAGRSCRQLLAICTELCRRTDSGTVHRYTITTEQVERFRANTSLNILTLRRSAQVKYTDCLTLGLQT
jgi:hypothetical protein